MTNSVSYFIEDKSLMTQKISICHLYPSTRILSLDENVNMIVNDCVALFFPNLSNKISHIFLEMLLSM